MAAPGSLAARYDQLAGPHNRRIELYWARKHLGFSIDEWLALPWWQRRVYIEGMEDEADERRRQADQQRSGSTRSGGGAGMSGLDALYSGTLDDVARTTAFGVN